MTPACPVCRAERTCQAFEIDGQAYWHCFACDARFLDPRHHLSPEAERAHYLHHENDPADPDYRRFLSRLADPLLARLAPGLHGLDYGCGPGPALAAMLREAGHLVSLYDPFFHPDPAVLETQYDFITCTEAAEHFHRPAEEFDRLYRLLNPGGWLGLMTGLVSENTRFADWHYRRDPTHVVFYSATTFQTLANQEGWECNFPARDIVLLRKPGEPK